MPRVALHTLGCKLNYAETSTIGKQFLDRGYSIVPFGDPAEVNIINTCSVTAKANQECRQVIRRALRAAPDSYVIVTGCYAQLAPEEVYKIEGVDLVAGTGEKFSLLMLGGVMEKLSCASVHVSPIDSVTSFSAASTTEAGGRNRAFLKVQDGCDYTCSFCTIPMARGASRSQSIEKTVLEAQKLIEGGYREIVLTGVNVGDYGQGSRSSFFELIRSLIRVRGLERLRISSIEPNLLTDDILQLMSDNTIICNHLHIPLQSGSDVILGRMRRRYRKSDYARVVEKAARLLPNCGIGADIIVGFPGETDELFDETVKFVADLPLSYFHVFTYSERPGTPASRMTEPVPVRTRSARNATLRSLGERKHDQFLLGQVGQKVNVLLESEEKSGLRFGFAENYIRVGVPSAGTDENDVVVAVVEESRSGHCIGSIIKAA